MAIREDLITQITTNLSSYTAFKVSNELPFNASDTPLYEKNMKTVYVNEQFQDVTEYAPTFSQDVMQTETTVNAYLTTDAKNQPSDIDSVISGILDARTGVANVFQTSSQVDSEITQDYITYTFEFNFTNL